MRGSVFAMRLPHYPREGIPGVLAPDSIARVFPVFHSSE